MTAVTGAVVAVTAAAAGSGGPVAAARLLPVTAAGAVVVWDCICAIEVVDSALEEAVVLVPSPATPVGLVPTLS